MYLFNALQITSIFATMPFLIYWISNSTWPWATALAGVACAGYLFLFGWITTLVYMGLCDGPK